VTYTAVLALQDGSLFYGRAIGTEGKATGEVVFNTAMTGYQEILTDPSYYQQIVTMTYPHIGNVGVNPEDEESTNVFCSGLIIKHLPQRLSNWRAGKPLDEYLKEHDIVAIADIDTRRLTRLLRDKGAQNGCLITGNEIDIEQALEAARAFPGLKGTDLARKVSTQKSYEWKEGTWSLEPPVAQDKDNAKRSWRVIAYDYGVKRNILRILTDLGCQVTVVPATTNAREVLAENPDGVFLSNGPGDPEPCDYAIDAIRDILNSRTPLFGICLGHQLLALAAGAHTEKMKFGHHGANHPVQDLEDGRVLITSQNHGFAVKEASLPSDLKATHRSLFDDSLQGIHHREYPAFGFQGHPEASPGPHDSRYLFNHFIELMAENASNK
jgi:carbamoyl-phosphate synthase small subunit